MKHNVGKTDRIIRIVAGVVIIAAGLFSHNLIISIVGLVPLATGIIRFCPAYIPLGINTDKQA